MLTGEPGPISYRELTYWAAYNKIEMEQYEQNNLANQARSNLPSYQGKAE